MVLVGDTTPRGGTSTRGKNPPQGGAAHGARAYHRGAHNTVGGPQGGTTPRGAPAHRGVPPTRQQYSWTVLVSESMSTGKEQSVRPHSGVFERAAYRIWWRLPQQSATWPGRVSMKAGLWDDGMAHTRAAGAEEDWLVVIACRVGSGGAREVRSRAR